MRTAAAIKKLILDIATADKRIRAVLLNGSRADATVLPDSYQDFDIVFIVDNIQSFTNNHEWINIFGEKIIQQFPQEMCFGSDKDSAAFPYLMLFKDGNRIDLTLFPTEKIATDFYAESLTVVWLDKDHLFTQLGPANNRDHFVKRPNAKEFADTCNEFWWVSTYVTKGLLRNQVTYAKEMMETVVRPMFMKVIEWKIGSENNFAVEVGKGGKFMQQHLTPPEYEKILFTYADHKPENNWKSLFVMIELFGQYAKEVACKLNFLYNAEEENNIVNYFYQLHDEEMKNKK